MKSKSQSFNIGIVVLLLAFLALMFVPYFTYKDVSYSINGYIWIYPKVLKPFFTELIDGYSKNNNPQIWAPALARVWGVLTLAVNFMKSDSLINQLVTLVWCLIVSIGFPLNQALKFGNMTIYFVLLGIALVIDVLAVLRLIAWIKAWNADPKNKRRRHA